VLDRNGYPSRGQKGLSGAGTTSPFGITQCLSRRPVGPSPACRRPVLLACGGRCAPAADTTWDSPTGAAAAGTALGPVRRSSWPFRPNPRASCSSRMPVSVTWLTRRGSSSSSRPFSRFSVATVSSAPLTAQPPERACPGSWRSRPPAGRSRRAACGTLRHTAHHRDRDSERGRASAARGSRSPAEQHECSCRDLLLIAGDAPSPAARSGRPGAVMRG